jgi:phospholipase/lecithinase/hemolysin
MTGLLHVPSWWSKQTSRRIVALQQSRLRQNQAVKSVVRFIVGIFLFGVVAHPSPAAFTSIYVFGDGVSTTTNGPGGARYHGLRYSNGRVWVEVLAQRQGLTYESNKNWSFFGHYSPNLVANVTTFVASSDISNALVVVWINNADFVFYANNYAPYTTNNIAVWTNAMNLSLSNHFTAIQTLYNKGVRTLIMPNAVDLGKVPYYVQLPAANKSFIRQRIIDYNLAFATRLNQARATFTNLVIYSPDLFTLLDDVVANSVNYGLTNALYLGQSVSALDDPNVTSEALNGPGTNHIFWDYLDPSAKCHAVIADHVQQIISPVRIADITATAGSSQIVIANTPVGRNGFVEGSTNFINWTTTQAITSSNVTQTVSVPATAPREFYRLRFPLSWSWP